jgi:hypothetical protein
MLCIEIGNPDRGCLCIVADPNAFYELALGYKGNRAEQSYLIRKCQDYPGIQVLRSS